MPICDKYVSSSPWAFFTTALVLGLLGSTGTAIGQTVILTPADNNLYNTGYSGTVLAGPNQIDTHYFLTNYLSPNAYQSSPTQPLWVPNASTPGSQWITIVPHVIPTNTPPAAFSHATFDYQLNLTNIPVGAMVTIVGLVAADDNATISANGTSPYFSNFQSSVAVGNFNHVTALPAFSFVAGTTNELTIAVSNVGGGPTGLNLNVQGSYYVALTSTVGLGIQFTPRIPLTPNQSTVVNTINQINNPGVANAGFANLTTALLGADPSSFGADLDQLSPEKLGVFSKIAVNDASFRTSDFDDYMAHRRNHWGDLQVNPGHMDTSGLTFVDPTVDPALSQVSSQLLAWSPMPTPGLLSDSASPLYGDFLGQPYVQPSAADDWNFFVRGNVVLGQNYSAPDIQHTDYTTSAFSMGTDYQFGKHFLVGALFGYGHTDTALDEQGSSATIDSYSPGVYASWAQGGWYADFLGTYSKNAYTEERHIAFGTFNETVNGAPDGDQETANLDGGYEFHPKDKHWTYGPTAGVQYTHLSVDGFNETGGSAADLSVNSESADSLRSRFGGRISYAMFDQSDKVLFTPWLDSSWQHEWFSGARGITSNFRDVSAIPFTVSTNQASRDSALLAAGLNADITDDMTLFTTYVVQVGENDYFGQSIQAGMKIGF